MSQHRAQPIEGENPSQVAIGIFDNGKEKPVEILRESVPEGFPPQLRHYLAEFMARGFNAACAELPSLAEFAPSTRGRPAEDDVEQEGQEASKLYRQNPKLGWQKIALKVCAQRAQPGHHCGHKCANRVRQAAKSHERKQELKRLARGED